MLTIVKKSKFLKYSFCFVMYAIAILFVIIGLHLAYDNVIDPDVARVLWLFESICMGFYTFACWMLFFLFYPKIYDFILEKDYLKQTDVKRILKRANYICLVLVIIAISFHFIWTNMTIIEYLIVTAMQISLFGGIATLVTIFSKSKHVVSIKKESKMNLLFLIVFLTCTYLCAKLSIDKSHVNPESLSVILILLMTINVNDKIVKEKFFDRWVHYLIKNPFIY